MKRFVPALVFLCAAYPTLAGEGGGPADVAALVAKAAPPDFSHFPPGTSMIRVRHTLRVSKEVLDITWEFEKGVGEAPLVPRHADVDVRRNGKGSVVFPLASPKEGPLESLRAYLAAFRRWDVETMGRYLPKAERESLEKDPAEGQDRLEEFESVLGMALDHWVDKALPSGGAVSAGVGSLELRYSYPGTSRGRDGMFQVGVHWAVEAEDGDHWIVSELEPSFREAQAGRLGKSPVAPGGLREAINEYAPPRIGGLRTDTIEFGVKGWTRFGGVFMEIRANFERTSPTGVLFLEGFSSRLWGGPPSGRAVPKSPPAEGPFLSVRRALTAMKTFDLETLSRYQPPEAREGFDEVGPEKLAEELKRDAKKRGYSRIDTALENLPGNFTDPRTWSALEVEWVIPGERRAREGAGEGAEKGYFEIRMEIFVGSAEAKNWLVNDLDVDFDRE
jgi:hypothetical protein